MDLYFKKELYDALCGLYSHERVSGHIETLYNLEKPRGYNTFDDSTKWCEKVLKEQGFSDVRRISHKADGKTAAYDFIMPQAWDLCERSTLKITEPVNEVIADSDADSIFVSEYSAPTPKGGITAELVDYATLDPENPDCKGKYVFYRGYIPPQHPLYNSLAKAGCAGIVYAAFETTARASDVPTWTNGHGHIGWYHLKEDPVVPTFCVSPQKGIKLLELLSQGKVVLCGEMNTKLYDGEIYTVTATIPGKTDDEFAILAHLYEPFRSDDCQGFAAGVEIAILIKKLIDDGVLPKPERTLRIIFSMERYGFAAFFENHNKRIIAATSIDSLTCQSVKELNLGLKIIETPMSLPFFGDMLFNELVNSFCPDIFLQLKPGTMSDDCWMSEETVDIPTIWCVGNSTRDKEDYHHTSAPIFDAVEYEKIAKLVPMIALYSAIMVCFDKEQFTKLAQKLEKTAKYWLDTKKNLVAGEAAMRKHSRQDAYWLNKQAEILYLGRMESFNRFYDGVTKPVLPDHWADDFCRNLPERELSDAEKRAQGICYKKTCVSIPFSQSRVPEKERVSWPGAPELIFALLSPDRSVLDAVRLQDAAFSITTDDQKIDYYLSYFEFLEKYGYIERVK